MSSDDLFWHKNSANNANVTTLTGNPSGTKVPPNSFQNLLIPPNSSQFLGLIVPRELSTSNWNVLTSLHTIAFTQELQLPVWCWCHYFLPKITSTSIIILTMQPSDTVTCSYLVTMLGHMHYILQFTSPPMC